jgi:glycosyltransferase involved in cell wall biosynthesis
MKTVLVCAVQAPFVTGGAEILVRELGENLARRGFRVDVVNVPFKWYPVSEIVRQALAWRLLDVTESNGVSVDLVIPTKFPSYLVRHPRKVAWLFHQHREAYDLHGTEYCSFGPGDEPTRQAIHSMDDASFAECRRIFTISRNVADRLARYNDRAAEALYPPPPQLGRYRTDEYGDFLFYAGRLDPLKRLDLAVEAVARARRSARLLVAGEGRLRGEIEKLAGRLGVEDRVKLLGFVSDEDLLSLYARCRATFYAPHNEDYGFVTVESFFSRKPVLTTTDSGGPLEFVTDGDSGLVTAPDADAIAEGIDRVFAAPEARLREMGESGHARVRGITWDRVVDCLTESVR